MSDEANGWSEYRKLVLHEIERLDARMTADFKAHMLNDERLADELNATLSELREEIVALRGSQTNIREDIAGLKALAGFIGGLAGAASSFIGRLF